MLVLNGDYRILFIPDLHCRASFNHRNDYFENENLFVLKQIFKIVEEKKIDIVIYGGDVYHDHWNDKSTTPKFQQLENMFWKIKNKVKHHISMMGNHEFNNYSKGNPWFNQCYFDSNRVLSQISQLENAENPIFEVYDSISINGKIIELFHYNKYNKNYTVNYPIEIGVYHDYICGEYAKSQIKMMTRYNSEESLEISQYISGVNHAIINDIHTPVGEYKEMNCLCDQIGTLGRTSSLQIHNKIFVPIFDFLNNGEVIKTREKVELQSFEESFDTFLVKEEREKRKDLIEFKKSLAKNIVSSDLEFDISKSELQPHIKNMAISFLNGQFYDYKELNDWLSQNGYL